MKNIIEGMNALKQTPIKDYTTLSSVITWTGVGLAILAIVLMIIFYSKIKMSLTDLKFKIFLLLYAFGIATSIFSMIRFPWFYAETGRYTYECTLEDDVSANYISENFIIIGVEDDVWKIEDK